MATHLRSKLVFYDIPASNLDASRKFYGALLGTDDFAPTPNPQVESYFHPISFDGIDMTLHQKRDQEPPDIPMAYFAVENLEEATKQLEELGGKVVHGPVDIPLPTGRALEEFKAAARAARQQVGNRIGGAVVMLDPDQNPVGVVQLEDHAAYYFRAGQFNHPLRADQLDGLRRALEQPG